MKTVLEPAKRRKVYGSFDVLVAGGGPAGVAAAVSAARNGAKVLLVERAGCLGGMGTAGLVPCFAPYGNSDDPLIRGIGYEVLERLRWAGGVGDCKDTIHWVAIDAEKLKVVYDEMVGEAGVRVLYFTWVSDAARKGDRIDHAIVENKSGRQAVFAKVFIDGTGDADLAARAGVPFEKGGKKGEMQSVTLCFVLADVDTKAYRAWFRNNRQATDVFQAAEAKGELKAFPDAEYRMIAPKVLPPGVLALNFGHVFGIDGTNADHVTHAMVRGRALAHEFVRWARSHVPGFALAQIVSTGSLLGVRETRRIRGEYELNIEDYKGARHFDDDIAVYAYPVDVHHSRKSDRAFEKMIKEYETLVLPPGKSHGIPYRSLCPKGVGNLLVAGRSVSADRLVQGSIRCMPSCFAMGEAAGTAASMAARERVPVGKIDVKRLRERLRRQGARIAGD